MADLDSIYATQLGKYKSDRVMVVPMLLSKPHLRYVGWPLECFGGSLVLAPCTDRFHSCECG